MSRKQLSMRKIGEVARLKASGLSVRHIARSCNVARTTVAEYLERLADMGELCTPPRTADPRCAG